MYYRCLKDFVMFSEILHDVIFQCRFVFGTIKHFNFFLPPSSKFSENMKKQISKMYLPITSWSHSPGKLQKSLLNKSWEENSANAEAADSTAPLCLVPVSTVIINCPALRITEVSNSLEATKQLSLRFNHAHANTRLDG